MSSRRLLLPLFLIAASAFAQKQPVSPAGDAPDAELVRQEFVHLLEKQPPAVRGVLSLDSALLSNKEYLEPYPALATYLSAHPEIPRNPAFYVGVAGRDFHLPNMQRDYNAWERLAGDIGGFIAFGMGIGLLTWLIRTFLDYRRWHRLSTVQTSVHTKILDRFSQNEELLAYIQSPAGARFLESSPIMLDPGPRGVAAPLGRILWSLQAGLVVSAAGLGLQYAAKGMTDGQGEPLHILGILGVALGLGLVASAGVSYFLSGRMGLLGNRNETAVTPGSGVGV